MRPLLFGILLILAGGFVGCSRPPAVEFDNLPLIASLRTACSARNEQWLAGVAKAVEQRHGAGKMSADEREHFTKLIEMAQSGEWEAAERRAFQFEQAQLSRRREGSPAAHSHPHAHDHAAAHARTNHIAGQ
ncbi:MAG: hypothetical protein SFU86_05470 [Pirellulaceae bacterium]|nr:hypothetical protein [Pirellulaceae bacterium]